MRITPYVTAGRDIVIEIAIGDRPGQMGRRETPYPGLSRVEQRRQGKRLFACRRRPSKGFSLSVSALEAEVYAFRCDEIVTAVFATGSMVFVELHVRVGLCRGRRGVPSGDRAGCPRPRHL
jgi:hypothetical protein